MDTEPYRIRLEDAKMALEHEMSSVGRRNPRVPDDWEPAPIENGLEADQADQADVFVAQETNAAILSDLEARYDAILSALGRIEKQTYGFCSVCGEAIEHERLDADPSSTTCIAHR